MMNSPPPSPSRATTPFGVSPRSGSPITLRPITPRPWPTLSYLQAPAGFGAPHRSGPSRTNYGYERMIGVAPFPSPLQKDRTRFDACLIRPSRSLTVKEIRDGALDGPNVDNYQKLLAKNQMSVQEHARQQLSRSGHMLRRQTTASLAFCGQHAFADSMPRSRPQQPSAFPPLGVFVSKAGEDPRVQMAATA